MREISVQSFDTVYYTNYYSLLHVQKIRKKYEQLSAFEHMLIAHNIVPIQSIDTSIKIDLKYAGKDNFWNTNFYTTHNCAYLEYETALKLRKVQQLVWKIDSSFSLLVYDALRPYCVQVDMWNQCSLSGIQKRNFLASPKHKSLHNYGLAVDVTLCRDGKALDMGTHFDVPGRASCTYNEDKLVNVGTLSKQQVQNRRILRRAMKDAGFIPNKYEWWHFSSEYRENLNQFPYVHCFDSIGNQ
ncbi:MAG: M15 family metallopeptidase [Bacteroidota bacterium]